MHFLLLCVLCLFVAYLGVAYCARAEILSTDFGSR